jgi:hypothetical protein
MRYVVENKSVEFNRIAWVNAFDAGCFISKNILAFTFVQCGMLFKINLSGLF